MQNLEQQRLSQYLEEAQRHKQHMQESMQEISLPIESYDDLSKMERFAINTLIFRFSKLQDLLGGKLFRSYLSVVGYPVEGIGYFELLRELEKEGVLNLDDWNFLRALRNEIAHDYPQEMAEMLEKVNLFVEKSKELIAILDAIKEKYDAFGE